MRMRAAVLAAALMAAAVGAAPHHTARANGRSIPTTHPHAHSTTTTNATRSTTPPHAQVPGQILISAIEAGGIVKRFRYAEEVAGASSVEMWEWVTDRSRQVAPRESSPISNGPNRAPLISTHKRKQTKHACMQVPTKRVQQLTHKLRREYGACVYGVTVGPG